MEDASANSDTPVDLKQFRRWYKQAGTPEISVQEYYDEQRRTYTLSLSQQTPATPGQDSKQPFHIPVKLGLMDQQGKSVSLHSGSQKGSNSDSTVLDFTEEKQDFTFENVTEKPVLSILQGYSAPVKLSFERSDEEMAMCMGHETDDFNRWEAGQQLSTRLILSMVKDINAGESLTLPDYFVKACRKTLLNNDLDKALIARALTLPSLTYIGEMMPVIDVDAIHQAREFIYSHLAQQLQNDFLSVYQANTQESFSLSPDAMAERFLRNQALGYLMYIDSGEKLALAQYQSADNMTNQMAAFRALLHHETESASDVTEHFYQQWQGDNLVLDKWFTVQATVPHVSAKARVKNLFGHADFDIRNPNRVRSLLGAFCSANPTCFHDEDGFGYALLGRYIEEIDVINPQIASRLCVPLTRWKRHNEVRQQLMKAELQRLIALPALSRDVTELVEKSLK
jgi:aminopeptidase N